MLADDFQEGIIVSDILDDRSVASVVEESAQEVIEEELELKTDDSENDVDEPTCIFRSGKTYCTEFRDTLSGV